MTQMLLFKPIKNHKQKWWTWSDSARSVFDEVAFSLRNMPLPKLVHLRKREDYDYTYTLPLRETPPSITRGIRAISHLLASFNPGRNRLMFRDLVRPGDPRKLLHVVFALLRQAIVEHTGDPMSCLYAPLGTTGAAAGEFRLHADLYVPRILFNVFDHVAPDGTGASTFLKIEKFQRILRCCTDLPRPVRFEIERLFSSKLEKDRYERFIDLVHDETNPWHDGLWNQMRKCQEVIPMNRGEGYMLNDRAWLHGRTEPSNKVSRFRVHRLVFG